MVDLFSGSSIQRCKVTSEGLPPFQPPRTISRKFLSLKTVFLLALASGRRGSEIHALSGRESDSAFEHDGLSVGVSEQLLVRLTE